MILSRVPHIFHDTIFAKKMFQISEDKHLRLRKIYEEISYFNNISKSKGYLLDLLGENFKIYRLGKTDEEYKKELKFIISSLIFMGSPKELKKILSLYFEIEEDDFFIYELSGKVVINIPENIKKSDVLDAVKKIKTAGVGLTVDFEIYIEDYTVAELETMILDDIKTITLARR